MLVKELQSLGLSVDLVKEDGDKAVELDAEEVLATDLDAEVDDLGTEKLIKGEEAVADMPLVDLANAASEDEFEVLQGAGSDSDTEDKEEV